MNSSTGNQFDIMVGVIAARIIKLYKAGKCEEARQERTEAAYNYGEKIAKELDELIVNFATFGLPK